MVWISHGLRLRKSRPRLVPLIGLDLATSSAVRSAASAASEHLEEMEQIAFECRITQPETSEESGSSAAEPPLPGVPRAPALTASALPGKSCLKQVKSTAVTTRVRRSSAERSDRLTVEKSSKMPRQTSAPASAAQQAALRRSWDAIIREGAIPTRASGGLGLGSGLGLWEV